MTGPAQIFTSDEPLGPTAITDEIDPEVFRLIYDESAEPNKLSGDRPPTFIIGRRGSGKTSLLLSTLLNPSNLVVHLRSDGIYSRVSAIVRELENRIVLTEEGVADIWRMLLWAPVSIRLTENTDDRDPAGEYNLLWEELTPIRNAVRESVEQGSRQDDVVLDRVTEKLLTSLTTDRGILAADTLASRFHLYTRPWVDCMDAARQLIAARETRAFVLIDSIENLGPRLPQLDLTLRGLFHLVGRQGIQSRRTDFRLQCCFPSELWPSLHRISANPLKDFAHSILLQWTAGDLVHLADARLEEFFERNPQFAPRGVRPTTILDLLPPRVTNRLGVSEAPLSYMLRHTQLLPRQFLQITNKALGRSLTERGNPFMQERDVVAAVSEVESILCPEIFSAFSHIYPAARDICHTLIPFLPFRFDDDYLHERCNRAGIRKRFSYDYPEIREMLTRLGILGRYIGAEGFYDRALFEYSIDGSLNLAPEDTFCLHPLFVRECQSRDIRLPTGEARPVYPSGTPEPSDWL
jgi:hypothetical protein